jgi:hypothetical protein
MALAVLAVGITRGWRSTSLGVAAAAGALALARGGAVNSRGKSAGDLRRLVDRPMLRAAGRRLARRGGDRLTERASLGG